MRKRTAKIKIKDIDLLVQIAQKMSTQKFLRIFELDSKNTTCFLARLAIVKLEKTDRILNEWDLAMLNEGVVIWPKSKKE